ncbi:MAG: TetR family transcriptional regulator [Clostridia bacterium]|nr:TetR family transcriptional regulator [Clostridia bacterium]
MEDRFVEESVRTRLILSGINELEEHGLADFSLRRAALAAQVSCAAPYRHFKDKDEYISEIIKYVNSKWELLSREIEKIFSHDPKKLATEMCMAALRFRIANRNFRSVFTLAPRLDSENSLDSAIISSVGAYADSVGATAAERELKIYTARALIAGSLMLVGKNDGEQILDFAREKLTLEFS